MEDLSVTGLLRENQIILTGDYGEVKRLFGRAVLDSISAHIAIINMEGVILETNRAWREFAAANSLKSRPDTLGINYLAVCDSVRGHDVEIAKKAAEGIRAVAETEIDEFVQDYACHSPANKRWFNMRVTRFSESDSPLLVISHEDITNLKEAQGQLQRRETDLKLKTQKLNELNTALGVLLDQQEQQRNEIENSLRAQIRNMVLPCLTKVKFGNLSREQLKWLALAEKFLDEIISPLSTRLTSNYLKLTPKEIRMANLIKEGYSSKEIASFYNMSVRTVEFHRANLRRKLGLKKREGNLRTYLLSIS